MVDQPALELPPVDPNVDNEPAAFDLAMPQQFNEEEDDDMEEDDVEEEEETEHGNTSHAVNDLSASNLDALRNSAGVMV